MNTPMEAAAYGGPTDLTVRDDLLLIAYFICDAQRDRAASADGRWLYWQGDKAERFTPTVGLTAHLDRKVTAADYKILEATLKLAPDTDDEMIIGVKSDTTATLDDDPYAVAIRDGFYGAFAASARQLCFDGLIERLRASQSQDAIEHTEAASRREPPRIIDSRRWKR